MNEAHKILIVDDDADLRAELVEFLGDEGYECVEAANGYAALELIRNGFTPCLVVLDLMMPVMSGWEFLARQQSDPELTPIPVLIVTAFGDKFAASAEGKTVKAVAHKPFDVDLIMRVVKKHC